MKVEQVSKDLVRIEWEAKGFTFVGRNGGAKCHGLEVFLARKERVDLQPITSKGSAGNCHIEIPTEAVSHLISILLKLTPGGRGLCDEVRDALEGDSNDAEHDALASVAAYLEIDYDPEAQFKDEEDDES